MSKLPTMNTASSLVQPPPVKEASQMLVWTNVAGYAFNIIVNILAAHGRLGPSNAEISSKYPTVITPMGWAFSIWGIIFTLEMFAVGIQAYNLRRATHGHGLVDKMVSAVGYCWQLGWAGQIAWQLSFARENMLLALASITVALAAFLVSILRLHRAFAGASAPGCPAAAFAVGVFFSGAAMNAAWLSAAASVQFLIYNQQHPTGLKEECTGVALIVAAGVAGAAMLGKYKDVVYPATLVWALVAIHQNTESADVQLATKALGFILAAATACAALCKTCKGLKCCPCSKMKKTCGGADTAADDTEGRAGQDEASDDVQKKLLP